MVECACHPSEALRNRRISVQAGLGKKRDNISKITTAKGAGDATQVTEYMLRKCEALNSNSSTTKKKN
jgi:hypothetical protein